MQQLTREELETLFSEGHKHMIEAILAQLLWSPQPENIAAVRSRQTIDYILWLDELVGKTAIPPAKEEVPPITAPPEKPIETDVLPLPPSVITPGGSYDFPR